MAASLLRRGYSVEGARKVPGECFLRVIGEVGWGA